MTARVQGRIAWSLVVLAVVAGAVAVALAPDAAKVNQVTTAVSAPVFAAVGALIVSRRGGHVVGWLLVVAGVGLVISDLVTVYAFRGLVTDPGSLPAATLAAWAATWVWTPGFFASVFVLPLVFPDGRLPSPRWRPLLAAIVVLAVVQVVVSALAPDLTVTSPVDDTTEGPVGPNPLGVAALARFAGLLEIVVIVVFFPMLFALVASVVTRYRRSVGVERYQLRWFLYSVALLPFGFLVSALNQGRYALVDTVGELLFLAIPISIGVAVLRYRLYEIDRIVSRTATYAVVTAVLVSVYAAVAVLPSALLDVESDLLVAAATLAAAGVFVPVRRRVQHVVDRRFNRARYDAQQVVERFGDRLRGDLDLDGLTIDLRNVIVVTVQPEHVSLWLPEVRS